MNQVLLSSNPRSLDVTVLEAANGKEHGPEVLVLGSDIQFSTHALESYATSNWDPVVFDAMVVAAAVEYCDRSLVRSKRSWARRFTIRVPVHDQDRWNAPQVSSALHDALCFLTGDSWHFQFVSREESEAPPRQGFLEMPPKTEATLAFSDGMDSRAVAGLVRAELGQALVRVRLGSKRSDRPSNGEPFTVIPYKLKKKPHNAEPSARNRGFRFAIISGLASYICGGSQIVIPESGQGALGPVLAPVAHAYPDYRNHPAFLRRMQSFLSALLCVEITHSFPRIWYTKGQTLAAYIALGTDPMEWKTTRSCWKSAQWSSVDGQFRQCGVCAACMLRRMSVHAAGQSEVSDTYVAYDLSASDLARSVPGSFKKMNKSFREYAIAGVLHMDHLADLTREDGHAILRRQAIEIADAQGMSVEQTEHKIREMIQRHADEWSAFVASLGSGSFVKNWVRGER
ncbi:7-cyano-7-deazaguanine synthase [Cognatishimia activa]|uniref:7-cyano-7-deazaguanine synthase n=1 Tax=Cognatishimia activa TaxID=1715691 RepID=A0A975EMN9_9RHOB|nr:7-cyano-7-deazaguanine synthase [Cognatishimia activa]QTN34835.1 7-cyano-7-deazaguanine synthase [Cognatishimia activa]